MLLEKKEPRNERSALTCASLLLSASFYIPAKAADELPGTAAHPDWKVLAADKGHVAIINAKGEVEWEVPIGHTSHDIAMLPNGNFLLHTSDTTIEEMTPDKQVVWKHVSTPTDAKRGVQIHAFQRLANGNTMVSESGNCRIIEVDKDDKIVKEFPAHRRAPQHPQRHPPRAHARQWPLPRRPRIRRNHPRI